MSALRQKIEQKIRERGPIPFSRYMELCLYDAEHGYYARNAEQFGKSGDFYTSSDVHAVFGRLMARQFDEMWRALGSPEKITVVELGPGRGLFAQDVLDWSEKKFPEFFRALRYVLVETSPALRHRIEATLACHLESGKAESIAPDSPSSMSAVSSGSVVSSGSPSFRTSGFWVAQRFSAAISSPPTPGALAPEVPTILFANEFFDALPVEVLSAQGSLRIDARDGRFLETWVPPSTEELEFLDRHSIHPEPGERVEVQLTAQDYMHQIASTITRGFLIAIDYGYTRAEQLAGRHRGTLKAIRQHSVSANPYEAPGEQDITADVNFTALAATAEKQGMQTQKLITQSQFLMGIGEATQFADAFEDCRLPQERAKVALQLKHLVTPAGMGESFQVLIASKGIEEEKVTALAGLNFGRRR
jgi:SAM-dependent MidA family methyltransferase